MLTHGVIRRFGSKIRHVVDVLLKGLVAHHMFDLDSKLKVRLNCLVALCTLSSSDFVKSEVRHATFSLAPRLFCADHSLQEFKER